MATRDRLHEGTRTARASLPPGPRGRFISGNLSEFIAGRLDFLVRCARDYGDVVALRFGTRRLYALNHPQIIEEALVPHDGQFIKHYALRLNPLLFGKGLLTSEGDFWLKQRRLVQPAFNRQRIASYAAVMVESTQAMLQRWQPGATCDIYPELMQLTLDIAAKTLFGAEAAAAAPEVGEALFLLQDNFQHRLNRLLPLPMWLPTPENLHLRRVIRRLDAIIYRFINQRRHDGQARGDLLSLLLAARDEDDGSRMSDQQVRDEAMTLFLAGHETTALALSWAWFLLSQNPAVEDRLASEVRQVLGGRLPAVEDVPRLSYVEKVVVESMRLYPPAWVIGREATRDCVIGGFHTPRGTTLLMSQWVLHHDARFFEEPYQFRPERWTDTFTRQLPKFAYFPFGGGPRLCVGKDFAMMEMVLVLAAIAQRFRFTLQPGAEVKPWPTFTLRPEKGVAAILTTRP